MKAEDILKKRLVIIINESKLPLYTKRKENEYSSIVCHYYEEGKESIVLDDYKINFIKKEIDNKNPIVLSLPFVTNYILNILYKNKCLLELDKLFYEILEPLIYTSLLLGYSTKDEFKYCDFKKDGFVLDKNKLNEILDRYNKFEKTKIFCPKIIRIYNVNYFEGTDIISLGYLFNYSDKTYDKQDVSLDKLEEEINLLRGLGIDDSNIDVEDVDYIYHYKVTTVKKKKIKNDKEQIKLNKNIIGRYNVQGKTFDYKEELKEKKFRWNPDEKVWYKDIMFESDFEKITQFLKEFEDIENIEIKYEKNKDYVKYNKKQQTSIIQKQNELKLDLMKLNQKEEIIEYENYSKYNNPDIF